MGGLLSRKNQLNKKAICSRYECRKTWDCEKSSACNHVFISLTEKGKEGYPVKLYYCSKACMDLDLDS